MATIKLTVKSLSPSLLLVHCQTPDLASKNGETTNLKGKIRKMEEQEEVIDVYVRNGQVESSSAMHRRRILEEAEKRARTIERERLRALRRKRIARGFRSVGNALQKINIGKWIDDLEKDQELADELDRINAETAEEQERKAICREAEASCLEAIRGHMESFINEYPSSSYEDWIRELHPDNVQKDGKIDARFYVEGSDHRQMWNESIAPDSQEAHGFSRKNARKPIAPRTIVLPV